MFGLTVRDHVMVAHSLPGAVFGPAQALHGATFVVDATFRRRELDADGLVVDIGKASAALREVLAGLGYRNLDEDPSLAGVVTTSERLAQVVADRLADQVASGGLGVAPGDLSGLVVTMRESHVAWATYERDL